MNPNRKHWNEQQQLLQKALLRGNNHRQAIELFLEQHARLHADSMAETGAWSFEDEVLDGLNAASMRCIPKNSEHSIAWILWHLARIEDVTMNMLIAGTPQILVRGGWLEKLKTDIHHTGNAMTADEIALLSQAVDVDALKNYRVAVGRRTREIVGQIRAQELKEKVNPARLQAIREVGAVVEAASEISAYWGGRTIAGLLLMPPTRHNFLHLNEALRVRQKCLKP